MISQKRFVSWAAVSSEEQARKISLDDQRKVNREHVARWQGVMIEELEVRDTRSFVLFEDAMRRHEAYGRLKQLIDSRSFDVLIFLDSTRLGRTHSLVAAVSALCEQAGVQLYETSSPPVSLDGPVGTLDSRMLTAFKGVMSHNEIDRLVRRAHMGRQARVRRGKHAGNPPFGYKRIFDDRGIAHTVINEEEAKVVRLFYELYLRHGRSLAAICAEFTGLGYVSPQSKKPWVPGTLRQLIVNCWTYAGYSTWGNYSKKGERFRAKAEWEPIIDEDLAREADVVRAARAYGRRAISSASRYSMLAKCTYCGGNICIHEHADNGRVRTSVFICLQRCRESRVSEPVITEALEIAIIKLQDAANLEELIDDTPDRFAVLSGRRQEVSNSLEQVRAQRKELTLVYTRGTISLDEYETLMSDLHQRQSDLARTLAEIGDQLAATPNAKNRRERLEEIRDAGMAMLHHPDPLTANAWLKQHFLLYIRDRDVEAVDYL